MHVIGTAGHVDHGKSTLVTALTGINPDRLKEEQEREMTIDLGFAWLTLPDGETLGIVDVPGHSDYIENMLAGVGGIDTALLIIAADEGMMPQTREHLDILDLLQVKNGVVVLTKTDLVKDTEWLDMVEMDIREKIMGTVFTDAPLVRVSARTGAGLDELISIISHQLEGLPDHLDLGKPRLCIDRAFSMHGFGSVVTGTLMDGKFRLGDEVTVLPAGVPGRIRGLQSYKNKVDEVNPGNRTAINIAGIELSQVKRGDVVCLPGSYPTTARLDAYVRILPGIQTPIKHASEVKFYIGAAQHIATLRLLDGEVLQPGGEGWVQIELTQPVVAAKEDRFILRRPSPGETIGGGIVVNPFPKERHKRFSKPVLDFLQTIMAGEPKEVLFKTLLSAGIGSVEQVLKASALGEEKAQQALIELVKAGEVKLLTRPILLNQAGDGLAIPGGSLIIAQTEWESQSYRMVNELTKYHHANPLRTGMLKEELKSRLKLSPRIFNALLQKWLEELLIAETGRTIKLPEFNLKYSAKQQESVNHLLEKFAQAPYSPPSYKECISDLGEDLVASLVDSGELIAVSQDVVFRVIDFGRMVDEVRLMLADQPVLTLAQVRDRFGASRRYAQAFLEYLDQTGITLREGEGRRLRGAKAKN